ncbi:MAG TPA: hypothetical protein VJ733_00060 [Candidatus Binatia bacterium]|nr:hypothetical protein [Candidatus Binatia bacterium]
MKKNIKFAIAVIGLILSPLTILADNGPAHRVDQTFPIQLGTSGGNINDISKGFCYGGTLGALVERNGIQFILSNNHVLARTNTAKAGESIIQPGLIDQSPTCAKDTSDVVAQLSDFISIRFKTKGTMPANNVDAAIGQVTPDKVAPTGSILDIGIISSSIADPALNMAVKKSGRTTGLTQGTISAVNATVDVSYGSGKTARFINQIIVKPGSFIAGGDSGSLMVEDVAVTPKAVGLLFAGSSSIAIANPIQAVLNAFGATMVGEGPSAQTKFLDNALAWLTSIWRVRETHAAQQLPEQADPAAVAAVTKVKERHEGRLMNIPGVVGGGVGLSERVIGRPAIEIYVKEATPQLKRTLPISLDGVEVKVVETGEIFAY